MSVRQDTKKTVLKAVLMGAAAALLIAGNASADPRRGGPGASIYVDNFVPNSGARQPHFDGHDHDDAREGVRSGKFVPLSQVLSTIRQKYPGKQLDTRQVDFGPKNLPCYDIRWLTPDGRRLDIMVNAQTGRIIQVVGL